MGRFEGLSGNLWEVSRPYGYVTDTACRLTRVQKELDVLKAQHVDVFCFQEVTEATFGAVASMLGENYQGAISLHGIAYWAAYQQDPSHPVLNGNATFINKNKFDIVFATDVPSYPSDGTGNHALYVQCTLKDDCQVFHFMNVHLDGYRAKRRKRELTALLSIMFPSFSSTDHTQVLMGDFNTSFKGNNLC